MNGKLIADCVVCATGAWTLGWGLEQILPGLNLVVGGGLMVAISLDSIRKNLKK